MLGHLSFSLELEVLDEVGVFVHGEDDVGHGLERVGEEFADVELAVIVDRGLVAGAVGRGVAQDLVDVLVLAGVALQRELKEGCVEVEGALQLAGLRSLDQLLDVGREEFIDAEAVLHVLDDVS